MDDLERTAIETACAKLIIASAHHTDTRSLDLALKLWAPDAVWETIKGVKRGLREIKSYYDDIADIPRGVHHITNMLITVNDADHAASVAYFIFYVATMQVEMTKFVDAGAPASAGRPSVMGRYFDSFRRTPEGWRFASRRMEFVKSA